MIQYQAKQSNNSEIWTLEKKIRKWFQFPENSSFSHGCQLSISFFSVFTLAIHYWSQSLTTAAGCSNTTLTHHKTSPLPIPLHWLATRHRILRTKLQPRAASRTTLFRRWLLQKQTEESLHWRCSLFMKTQYIIVYPIVFKATITYLQITKPSRIISEMSQDFEALLNIVSLI